MKKRKRKTMQQRIDEAIAAHVAANQAKAQQERDAQTNQHANHN